MAGSSQAESEAYRRFIASMEMNYDMSHDGTGYDLGALDELTEAERRSVEAMLKGRGDWRDVEALAHLKPPSIAELWKRFRSERTRLVTRLAAGEELEELGEAVNFVPLVLEMLDLATGDTEVLSRVFDFIEGRCPDTDERVKRKILKLLMTTRDERATNFAAIACVVYGPSPSQNDWTLRPFWLRFQERDDHDAAFAELLKKIGMKRGELLR